MTDLSIEVARTFQDAGYDTWEVTSDRGKIVCFENVVLCGFVYFFDTVDELLGEWKEREERVIRRFSPSLRQIGEKAWNTYSVFLTADSNPSASWAIGAIEEDFQLTRKITRMGLTDSGSVKQALLPLLPLSSALELGLVDFEQRLKERLRNLPDTAVDALFRGADARRVADLLRGHK
ncbi:hypothetical protein SAMN02744133_102468 [Thalassospira xiamenensis M-5 = DSM 17429]|uniref:Uncharacterized protein n=1 Tax=Thalassospira xiamenensis M-5 = DSM 17429 TaxID=1123366 RepID=A0AB72U7Z7_9PROT|nr:hypothetical protein [Thalassospira xiamenensis]AJD50325.1 hypothetical protein TH3_00995 [Thalassospira xiamenensis M-5 = DSM 17429]SIS81172.1 hypothetical protein SAMN02744133_102468 [Thalassospira xiamenensis M-5 = DSM 17429]